MPDLRADCERCFGLCCVAPAFTASSDFAIDKPAGVACRNLLDDFRCSIHSDLRERGFPGCTVFDCFGAGQKVAQTTFHGTSWREAPDTAEQMFAAFTIMRQLHELLWYLTEALTLRPGDDDLLRARDDTERLTNGTADELVELDVAAHRENVDVLLSRTSERVRAGAKGPDHRRADLIGRNLKGADLCGANLRGAYLIGADLRNADLRLADVIGADFRGADVRGADLSTSIFLTQFQVNAAKGDLDTRIPRALARPAHW